MPCKLDPDVFDIDIPICPRVRIVKPPTIDRDSANLDIPILFRLKYRLQTPTPCVDPTVGSGIPRAPPGTPAYWSDEMERESSAQRRSEAGEDDGDAWIVLDERGKHFGRVDMDEMTA